MLAGNVTGHLKKNVRVYSDLAPRVFLKNVKIKNRGIDRSKVSDFWRCNFERKEEVVFHLEENAELFAENLLIEGPLNIRVEKNTRLTLKSDGKNIIQIKEEIKTPSWNWNYLAREDQIFLIKKDA